MRGLRFTPQPDVVPGRRGGQHAVGQHAQSMALSMKVMKDRRFDAFRLAASRGEITGSVEPGRLPRLADRVESTETRSGRVEWSIRGAADEQGRAAINVSIEGTVPLQCQRCLGVLEHPVAQSTTLLLAHNDADLVHLDDVSGHEVVLASGPLDPVALVEDELLLTLPFAPRHETGCGDGE